MPGAHCNCTCLKNNVVVDKNCSQENQGNSPWKSALEEYHMIVITSNMGILDDFFQVGQLKTEVFDVTCRLSRNISGSGIILYVIRSLAFSLKKLGYSNKKFNYFKKI